MTETARELQNAYHREWRRNNKDKVRAMNQRYWEKKARQMAEAKTMVRQEETDGKGTND